MREFIDIDDIMATLDKKSLDDIISAKELSKDVLPTASYGINRDIGGGLRLGHQHTIYGTEGSTKTAFMLQTVAVNQRLGVPCFWFDAEGVFDDVWAEKLGVDVAKLKLSRLSSISKVTDKQIELIKKGVALIVIDSTSELMQTSLIEDGEMKNFDDTKQLGTQAKDLGKMSKMVQGMNYSCAIVHISQVRVDAGATGMNKPYIPAGGKEMRHNDSIKIRLSGSKAQQSLIKDTVKHGDILKEVTVGYPATWKVEKNRINGNEGSGSYDFYKKGEFIGVDTAGEVLDAGVEYGIVQKGGSWYTIYDTKKQGKEANKYLRDNPEILKKLGDEINVKSV